MSRKKSRFSFVLYLAVALSQQLVLVPPHASAEVTSEGKGDRSPPRVIEAVGFIEAVGDGILPVPSTDLTPAERVTAARTAALVDALRRLAEAIKGVRIDSPSGLEGTFRGLVEAVFGGTLRVSGQTVIEKHLPTKSEVVVDWPSPAISGAAGHLVVENFMLVSLDVQVFSPSSGCRERKCLIFLESNFPAPP